jgi:hypothetical protein
LTVVPEAISSVKDELETIADKPFIGVVFMVNE